MCNACAFYCCASDEFEGCGCDHCYDSACRDDAADDIDFGDTMPGDDEDDGGVLMPLAACGCAPARGFRCEAVA
ncbi:hypothetical protein ACFQE0_14030 [Methylobacterium komagatae]|uniref:Metallothionein n=1 Tax=Methylobacterium komagatae TaxID=374425 RepID=A0ABW2BJN9_9HYPH